MSQMGRMISVLFYGIASVILLVFFARLILCSMIFIFPKRSKTYRMLLPYGAPELLLKDCDESLNGAWLPIRKGEVLANEKFIVIPYTTYVYIAPLKELLWAYVALHVYRGNRSAGIERSLKFIFSSKVVKSVRVKAKSDAIRELERIKKLNPNMLVGFDMGLYKWAENDFPGFIEHISSNAEKLQKRISAKDQAETRKGLLFAEEFID